VKVLDETPTKKKKKKNYEPIANVKIIGHHDFHELRCCKVVMVRLNISIV
jgi:hypothetical protein